MCVHYSEANKAVFKLMFNLKKLTTKNCTWGIFFVVVVASWSAHRERREMIYLLTFLKWCVLAFKTRPVDIIEATTRRLKLFCVCVAILKSCLFCADYKPVYTHSCPESSSHRASFHRKKVIFPLLEVFFSFFTLTREVAFFLSFFSDSYLAN